MWARGLPSLEVFLDLVIALSITISGLTIFLSLYTAVTERTREIGILKSMGGSKRFILWMIESEALLLSLLGIALGGAVTLVAKWLIMSRTSLIVELAPYLGPRDGRARHPGRNGRGALSGAESGPSGPGGGAVV